MAIGSFSTAAGTGDVAALVARPSKTLVFTTTGSAYEISVDQKYIGFYNSSMKQIADNGIVVHDIKPANGGV